MPPPMAPMAPRGTTLSLVLASAVRSALGDDPRGTLTRNRELRGDGCEVERLANRVAERDDEFRGLHGAAGNELACGARGQAHLLFGAEQDEV